MNSILVPMFANYFIEDNIYDKGGLAEDVFYMAISSSFLTPIFKIIDFYYLYTRIMAWWYKRICNINYNLGKKIWINQVTLNSYN